MNADIQTALTVFLIGMLTVFIVLWLVIYTGKTVIWAVNLAAKKAEEKHLAALGYDQATSEQKSNTQLPAIVAAVEIITQGKGRIETIEWIE